MNNTQSISNVESLIARLPIDYNNFSIFEALLRIPYDVFRPIMDMLFDGSITYEDLVDTVDRAESASSSEAKAQESAEKYSRLRLSDTELSDLCVALINGKRPEVVTVPIDSSAIGVGANGQPASGTLVAFAPNVVGADSNELVPNDIEVARAGGNKTLAQKQLQQKVKANIHGNIE